MMNELELSRFFEGWLKLYWMSDHDQDDRRFHAALVESVRHGNRHIDNSIHEGAILTAVQRLNKRKPSAAERKAADRYGKRASTIMHFLEDQKLLESFGRASKKESAPISPPISIPKGKGGPFSMDRD